MKLAFVAAVLVTFGLATNCSSKSLGPVNGSNCEVNSDCASNCCLAGGYPTDPTSPAKVCTEPNGCVGNDGSTSTLLDSGSPLDTSAPVDTGTSIDTGTLVDTGTVVDTGAVIEGASPVDSSPGG